MQYSNKREPEEELEPRQLSLFETTTSFASVLQGNGSGLHCGACSMLHVVKESSIFFYHFIFSIKINSVLLHGCASAVCVCESSGSHLPWLHL